MNIHQFLHHKDIFIRDKKSRHTHTSIKPPEKYLIEGPYIERFWQRYQDQCHDTRLCITEKPGDVMPVLCDVDIKLDVPTVEDGPDVPRLYTEEMVLSLIQVYRTVLFEIVQDLKEDDFICCVLEKNPYFVLKNDKVAKKNGFHLHFPKIFLQRCVQEQELIPRIIQEVKKLNISKTFVFEKCIDTSYCKGGGWLLYGSSKSSDPTEPMYEPYELSFVIDYMMEKVNYKKALYTCNIYDSSQEKINFSLEEVDYYLPRIFSVSDFNRNEYIYELKEDLVPIQTSSLSRKQLQNNNRNFNNNMRQEACENLELVELLVDLLAPWRAEDRNEWIQVGWVLYNITDGTEGGKALWDKFSRTCSSKYDRQGVDYEWQRMKKTDVTLGSLKYMARTDNEKEYLQVISQFMDPYIEKTLELKGSHNDLAKALFQKYESVYVCASIQRKKWFEFHHHCWRELDEGINLRKKISEELVEKLLETKERVDRDYKHANQIEDSTKAKMLKDRIKVILDLIQKLKSAQYKNNVMKEAEEVFYNEKFIDKLDANPYLIAFQNGVYDLKNHQFRDGQPQDYLSAKLPIHFRQEYTADHPDVRIVQDFFMKMFPDTGVRDFFLRMSSEVFVGGNHRKFFQIWTGDGDNGKSIMQGLFEKMLGPYAIKLPTSLITGKRTQSSQACPELARAGNGARLAMLQEPEQTDIINTGILKELSGNDTMFVRGLYKEGREMTPMFKLVLICNEPPKIPNNDKATWNRVRVIPFESTFTDDAPESFEEQLRQKRFPKDKDFADRIPKMTEPFAWLLLHTLKYHGIKSLKEPEKVHLATQSYKKKNDNYKQFMEEFILENPQGRVDLRILFATFKDWFKESMASMMGMPTKSEVKEYFSKVWGDPVDKIYWVGYEIRNPFEDGCTETSSVSTTASTVPL